MQFRSSIIALGLVGALGAVAAAPAQADVLKFGGKNFVVKVKVDKKHGANHAGKPDQRRLGERQLRQMLAKKGFHDIGKPNFEPRRNVYLVQAEDRRGQDVRLTVNARNGAILDIDQIRRGAPKHGKGGPEKRR